MIFMARVSCFGDFSFGESIVKFRREQICSYRYLTYSVCRRPVADPSTAQFLPSQPPCHTTIMTSITASPCCKPSDDKTPRSILRSMDGAKAFLDPVLLDVPWLWRLERVKVNESAQLNSDELRTYGKIIRYQINVSDPL